MDNSAPLNPESKHASLLTKPFGAWGDLPPAELEKLERVLIPMLQQVWRMLGKRRKIVKLD